MIDVWYLVIGFLLGNGMPHFAFGAAGRVFRTPFGRHSSPGLNVGWGIFNFVVLTVVAVWRITVDVVAPGDVIWLLIGFWLAVAMFGAGMPLFLPKDE